MDFQNWVVTKENGRKEPFSMEKFRNSLGRARVGTEEIDRVVRALEEKIFPGITTREIYRMASRMLHENTPSHAARYRLKEAIMALGPSGYPFERFIAALFTHKGFVTEVGQVLQGHCITHEIDVLGTRGNERMLLECKYHNQAGIYVDVKVPMYIHSRFQDLLDHDLLDRQHTVFTGWIATNSKFSDDATRFAQCKGIRLLGWNFPLNDSLKDWIDASGLYPITCLTTLTDAEKKDLLEAELVLVKDLHEHPTLLQKAGIAASRMVGIQQEIAGLVKAMA